MKKLIVSLCLILTVFFSSLASANPMWAHDEPHEQWADFWYNINPAILPFILALFVCVVVIILHFWLNRNQPKQKVEAA